MSVQKTPVALIQVLDSEGKVTNFEIEYVKTYTGDDPDITRAFVSSRDREEVTAEVFATFQSQSDATLTGEMQKLALLVQEARDEAIAAQAACAEEIAAQQAICEQLRQDALVFERQVQTLTQKINQIKATLA